jgi:hypothetical protein
VLVSQKYCTRHVLATDVNHNYLFRMILIKSQILILSYSISSPVLAPSISSMYLPFGK